MWRFFGKDSDKDFNYEIEKEEFALPSEGPFNALHRGKKKDNGDAVSIFVFEKAGCHQVLYDIAQAYIRRLRSLRHPCILTYLDTYESDTCLYLVTEYVKPLNDHLKELSNKVSSEYLPFGIMQITKAVKFLHSDAKLRHNNLFGGAVYVTIAGEWKLGEVGYASSFDSPTYPVKAAIALLKYNPPESSASCIKYPWSVDAWGLGILMWEVYNGPIETVASLKKTIKIPQKMVNTYCELVHADPSSRPQLASVYERGMQPGSYFDNGLIRAVTFLEEIQIREKTEKIEFFKTLTSLIDVLPNFICMHKLLPLVVHAYDYGDAGVLALPTLLKLSCKMDEELFKKYVLPTVLKMFGSNDRATRCLLLENMNEYVDKIPAKIINDSIFPFLSNGFSDTHPKVRELTIKAILPLAPKLNQTNLDEGVLRHLARLQVRDDQPSIRTNTTVCLGKVAEYLQPATRKKILVSGFTRALQDTFPPARNAGVLALYASNGYFSIDDVALKILPALCAMCLDPDKAVRDNTFKAMHCFIKKLERVSEDPSLKNSMENGAIEGKMNNVPSWAGWATRAFKFYKAKEEVEEKSEETTLPEKNADQNNHVPVNDKPIRPFDEDNAIESTILSENGNSSNNKLFNFDPVCVAPSKSSDSFWDSFEPFPEDNKEKGIDCDMDFEHITLKTNVVKREARQKAMETRRKNNPGPMKLGTKIS